MKDLNREDASIYRAIVAMGNYLSMGGSDIRFGMKELARRITKPRNIDYRQLIHFGRYLRGRIRVVNKYA